MNTVELRAEIDDLLIQATHERSHFYVRKVLEDTKMVLGDLEEALKPLADPFEWDHTNVKHRDIPIDCCVKITYDDVLRAARVLGMEAPYLTEESP